MLLELSSFGICLRNVSPTASGNETQQSLTDVGSRYRSTQPTFLDVPRQ